MELINIPNKKTSNYLVSLQNIANAADEDTINIIGDLALKYGKDFSTKFKSLANNPLIKRIL